MWWFQILVLCLSLVVMTSCTVNTLALLDAIVVAAEIAIPHIAGVSPADAGAVSQYLNSGLTIAANLVMNGASQAGIQEAILAFQSLVVPQVSSAEARAIMQDSATAILNFLKAFQVAPAAALQADRLSDVPTLTNTTKTAALMARLDAARSQLRPRIP